MHEGLSFSCFPLLQPVGCGKGYCHTNNEHEERLDQIPKVQAVPLMMTELSTQELKESAVSLQKVIIEEACFAGKKEHGKSAEKIDRRHPPWRQRLYSLWIRFHFEIFIRKITHPIPLQWRGFYLTKSCTLHLAPCTVLYSAEVNIIEHQRWHHGRTPVNDIISCFCKIIPDILHVSGYVHLVYRVNNSSILNEITLDAI